MPVQAKGLLFLACRRASPLIVSNVSRQRKGPVVAVVGGHLINGQGRARLSERAGSYSEIKGFAQPRRAGTARPTIYETSFSHPGPVMAMFRPACYRSSPLSMPSAPLLELHRSASDFVCLNVPAPMQVGVSRRLSHPFYILESSTSCARILLNFAAPFWLRWSASR